MKMLLVTLMILFLAGCPQSDDPVVIKIYDKYVSFQQYGQDVLLLTKPFHWDDRAEDHAIRHNGKIILIIREVKVEK